MLGDDEGFPASSTSTAVIVPQGPGHHVSRELVSSRDALRPEPMSGDQPRPDRRAAVSPGHARPTLKVLRTLLDSLERAPRCSASARRRRSGSSLVTPAAGRHVGPQAARR